MEFLFYQKYPEKLYFEGLAEQVNPPMQLQPQYMPIYFGNVCLRFLPVFDIVIHRFLELLPVSKSLETLLDHLGSLYKFHGELFTKACKTVFTSNQKQFGIRVAAQFEN